MIQPLTLEEAKAGLHELAAEFPHRTAINRYEYLGQPCCIVGHLLHRAGVPVEELHRLDFLDDHEGILHYMTEEAWDYVIPAQVAQDDWVSWRDAVMFADRRAA